MAKKKYNHETEFSADLFEGLNGGFLFSEMGDFNNTEKVNAFHQRPAENGDIPDITLITPHPCKMRWRWLSNPFYIECKMNGYRAIKDITQIYRYKYKEGSPLHMKLKKYGDNHVVVAIPIFLRRFH